MGAIAKRKAEAVMVKAAGVVRLDQGGELVPVRVGPADRQPVAVYLARLGLGSRRTMGAALETVAGLLTDGRVAAARLPWGELRYQHTGAIRSKVAEAFAPATANKILSALRGVLSEAWRLGLMDSETYHRAIDLKSIKGKREQRGRHVPIGEVRALFEVSADDTNRAAAARDAALLALLFGLGLRRAEVAALDLGDFNPEDGEVLVRRGKGNKDRKVYASNGSLEALADWIAVRGSAPGALVLPVNKGGGIAFRRLSPETIRKALERRAAAAGIKALSPHDARRTFVSDLLDGGADIVTVQALAGHASPQTTARYDRRGDRAKKKAADMLAIPYTRRAR